MLEYITANEYKSILGITDVPSNFDELDIEASSRINKRTRGKIINPDEKVKYVTCLIINALNDYKTKKTEKMDLRSQTVEGWSETYKTGEELEKELNYLIEEIMQTYLWDTGLLSSGVMLVE